MIYTGKKNQIIGTLTVLWLFFTFHLCSGQQVVVESVKLIDRDVHIEYRLLDEDVSSKYTLNLYSSVDDYIQPLKAVDGDIGVDIPVGGNKKIIWRAGEEFGEDFQDFVSLELKGKLYVPFISLQGFDELEKIKREQVQNVTWQAGRGSNVLRWDLYNNKDELVYTFTNVANVGNYELEIPKEVPPGKGYYFKIADQDNSEEVVYTPNFMIKRKIPLFLKVAAGGALVGLVYVIAQSGDGGQSDDAGVENLPDPVVFR